MRSLISWRCSFIVDERDNLGGLLNCQNFEFSIESFEPMMYFLFALIECFKLRSFCNLFFFESFDLQILRLFL